MSLARRPLVAERGGGGGSAERRTAARALVQPELVAPELSLARDLAPDPELVRILPGLVPFVAESEAEAQDKFDALQALVDPSVGIQILTAVLGGSVDLSGYDIDGPVPTIPETEGMKTFQGNLLAEAREEGLTLRQLYLRYAAGFGHWRAVGSAMQIADLIEEAFTGGAADGFAISSAMLPGSLDDFARLVVPELQRAIGS